MDHPEFDHGILGIIMTFVFLMTILIGPLYISKLKMEIRRLRRNIAYMARSLREERGKLKP
jgi:predicted Holliday junction resolvase-like endonuclease